MHNKTNWDNYLYFLRVARLGTLKAAGKSLKVNHTTVLRRINSLEEKLETRLFERFKTGYVLTESGEDIYNMIGHLEDSFLAIERKIFGKDVRLEGRIKVSTTDTLGHYWLPPYIKKFKNLYPDILIDIDIRTSYTNLTKREADIVIPVVNKQPDYMVGHVLAPIDIGLYASKKYIAQNGIPEKPQQLVSHKLLILNEELGSVGFNEWLKNLIPKSAISVCSNMLSTLYYYVRQDMGIAPLPFYVGDKDQNLMRVMILPRKFSHNIWILIHPDLKNTRRIKTFMRFMYEETKVLRDAER